MRDWLESTLGLPPAASEQLTAYLATARAALGVLPTRRTLIFERFFDEVGDTHLVIHSPFGSRLNRAWGLALRKRFCRQFNFELQAAALEDSIVLSLGPTHSFPLEEIRGYLRAETVREVLTQATLQAPMFPTRWRWVATTALAIRRYRNGRKVPPQFQRSDSDDLLALVFPDQVACAENIAGDRQVPDHPLVHQTLDDCLNELMDVTGLEALLRDLAAGHVEILTRELTTPSPLAQEIISARPYAFLDDAPAEERRTLAIRTRNLLDPEEAATIGRLDPEAIRQVCLEAWPEARTPDELHDGLTLAGFLAVPEIRPTDRLTWPALLAPLLAERRATVVAPPGGQPLWVSAERLAQLQLVRPDLQADPPIDAAHAGRRSDAESREQSLRELLRSRLETLGPVTAAALAAPLGVAVADAEIALLALEVQGQAMRGRFSSPATGEEWCDRRLLARIHRYTLKTLRRSVEPVSPAAYMRFLLCWHQLGDEQPAGPDALRRRSRPPRGLPRAGRRLGGEPPAGARCGISSRPPWTSCSPVASSSGCVRRRRRAPARQGPIRTTPILFMERQDLDWWQSLLPAGAPAEPLSANAAPVHAALLRQGAMFFTDLQRADGVAGQCGGGRAPRADRRGARERRRLCRTAHAAGCRQRSVGKPPASPGVVRPRRLPGAGRWSWPRLRCPAMRPGSTAYRGGADGAPSCSSATASCSGPPSCGRPRLLPPWRELVQALATARGPRRDPRRALRGGLRRRAVRPARGRRPAARGAPRGQPGQPGDPLGRRSAEPHRHRHARGQGAGAAPEPGAVPERRAGGGLAGRGVPLAGRTRCAG